MRTPRSARPSLPDSVLDQVTGLKDVVGSADGLRIEAGQGPVVKRYDGPGLGSGKPMPSRRIGGMGLICQSWAGRDSGKTQHVDVTTNSAGNSPTQGFQDPYASKARINRVADHVVSG